jgi:thioredoxin-related protein
MRYLILLFALASCYDCDQDERELRIMERQRMEYLAQETFYSQELLKYKPTDPEYATTQERLNFATTQRMWAEMNIISFKEHSKCF